ncbi:unnamed protein product, partial [Durusdinium trenchii]
MPQVIWHLIDECQGEYSWYQHLMEDLQWLCTQNPSYDWPEAGVDLQGWCLFIGQCAEWNTLVSKAAKAWLRFQIRNATHQLWERELHRLIAHLRTACQCIAKLRACFPPMTEEEVQQKELEDVEFCQKQRALGLHVRKAILPACKVPSALLPEVGSVDAADMLARKVHEDEIDEPWLRVSGHFAGSGERNEVGGLPEGGFVFQAAGGPIEGDLNRFCPNSLIGLDVYLLTEAVVFVHLFAGHRRHQDLHWQIENQTFVASRCVYCISIDLCLQGELGNLIGKHPIAFWVDQIRKRRIIGVGGGPPCETWTAARWMPGGPKPLRDQARPWGLPFLSRKQDRQVSIGTELLHTIVQLMWEAAIMGGCAWLEHPQVAVWAGQKPIPSIWRLRAL